MNILLGICGGIAAYKTPELVRRLKDRGADVQVVMTRSAHEFVTETTLQAVSGRSVRENRCSRAVLVGHNAHFDLGFLNAAIERSAIKRNPFHPFSTFDTVSLAGLAYGQTVLSRAAQAAGLPWDNNEAHSALYDAKQTAELFCVIINRWAQAAGPVWSNENNGSAQETAEESLVR